MATVADVITAARTLEAAEELRAARVTERAAAVARSAELATLIQTSNAEVQAAKVALRVAVQGLA